MNMKITIATPLYPPEIGGPATYTKLLEEGLPQKGIEIELVKFSAVRHLPKFIRHVAYFLRMRHALRGADLALALDPVSVGLPTCLAAWVEKKPFVVKIVGDYAWEQGQQRFGITANLDEFVKMHRVPLMVRFLRRVQSGVATRAAHIIVPSEYLKSIVTAWGIPQEKIEVIYNAVSIGSIGVVPESIAGLPRPLIVTAGRLVPWKHIDGVIDAVANIPGASLVVVGDGSLREKLVRHADAVLPARAAFTGMVSHQDTLAILQSADAFVLNSSYEGLSHLLIEAQMLGVPTIATRVGGNSEVITDDENGLLISAGDTGALTRAIERICSEEVLRTRFSACAIESARRFSIDSMLSSTAAAVQYTYEHRI